MRHRKSGKKLKRTASHRKATLIALATALLRHKRISTTVAKAKEARKLAERFITRAKNAVAGEGEKKNVFARREISRHIKDREVIKELFTQIAPKVQQRAGGYTRVIKLGQRHGDGAEVAIVELVDFQLSKEKEPAKPAAAAEPKPKPKRKKKESPKEAAKTE